MLIWCGSVCSGVYVLDKVLFTSVTHLIAISVACILLYLFSGACGYYNSTLIPQEASERRGAIHLGGCLINQRQQTPKETLWLSSKTPASD